MNKSNAEIELEAFWKDLFGCPLISTSKMLKFNDRLFKLLLRVQELEASRQKWRVRAESVEKELKTLKKWKNA